MTHDDGSRKHHGDVVADVTPSTVAGSNKSGIGFNAGAVMQIAHPFIRETVSLPDFDGENFSQIDKLSWRPGIRDHVIGYSWCFLTHPFHPQSAIRWKR